MAPKISPSSERKDCQQTKPGGHCRAMGSCGTEPRPAHGTLAAQRVNFPLVWQWTFDWQTNLNAMAGCEYNLQLSLSKKKGSGDSPELSCPSVSRRLLQLKVLLGWQGWLASIGPTKHISGEAVFNNKDKLLERLFFSYPKRQWAWVTISPCYYYFFFFCTSLPWNNLLTIAVLKLQF